MTTNTMLKLSQIAGALLLTGCVSLNPNDHKVVVVAGPQPTAEEVEPQIKAYLQQSLKDPDSLKQFRIIGFVQTRWIRGAPINREGSEQGWLACFEYNAKNSYGAYTGLKTDGLVFRKDGGETRLLMHQLGAIMSPRC